MPRIAYVNGRYVPLADAAVHIEDRGYQFADGVYEVCLVVDGLYWDEEGHLDRLERSLHEVAIARPMSRQALKSVMSAVLRRNRLRNALVYMQVTRGVAPRNHAFPPAETPPALVMTARTFDLARSDALAEKGVAVVTRPEPRQDCARWWPTGRATGRFALRLVTSLPSCSTKPSATTKRLPHWWPPNN